MSKHHSHEISEHPEVQWALELLKPDPAYEPSILSKYSPEIVCTGSGFAIPSLANVLNNKPFYAGECPARFPQLSRPGTVSSLGRPNLAARLCNNNSEFGRLHQCALVHIKIVVHKSM